MDERLPVPGDGVAVRRDEQVLPGLPHGVEEPGLRAEGGTPPDTSRR